MRSWNYSFLTNMIIPYHKFRTGLTYQDVSDMVWSYQDDPATWPKAKATKRRPTVLGKWHQIKLEMYQEYLQNTEEDDLPF